jgi:hypothetical protein
MGVMQLFAAIDAGVDVTSEDRTSTSTRQKGFFTLRHELGDLGSDRRVWSGYDHRCVTETVAIFQLCA